MKLFPTVIALALCSCLICNVQQSYAKNATGKKKMKLSRRVAALEEALGAIINTTSSLSDQFASGIVKVKAIAERVNKVEEFATKVGTLETAVGTLKEQLAAKRCTSGRAVFSHVQQQGTPGGVRKESVRVKFAKPFATTPVVTTSFVYIDANKNFNLRVRTYVSNVGPSGFDLRVEEWYYSVTYMLHVAWMACSN